MAIIDLAYTTADQKEMKSEMASTPEMYAGPKYPWGLQLHLDDKVLEKLGKTVGDFKVGADLPLSVIARVTGVSMNERDGGEKTQCLDLTITGIDMPAKIKDPAKSIFGGEG